MVGADKDLRKVIDSGSFTANQLRTFLEQNEAEVSDLLKQRHHSPGAWSSRTSTGCGPCSSPTRSCSRARSRSSTRTRRPNLYETHVGLILADRRRPATRGTSPPTPAAPQNVEDRPLNQNARCTEPPTESNPRGYPEPPAGPPRPRRRPGRQRADHRDLRPRDRQVRGRAPRAPPRTSPWHRAVTWRRRRSERTHGSGSTSNRCWTPRSDRVACSPARDPRSAGPGDRGLPRHGRVDRR